MKALIIDRVTLFNKMISAILADTDIEHVFSSSAKEALEILEKDKFECICLALYLDDMDGYELSKEIRKLDNYRHTPIVLLTSKNNDEITKQAISSGITDVFSKDNVHEIANFIARFTEVEQDISGRVLYIEDQKSQRDYVKEIFKARGLEVDAFDNAEDALQAFLKNHYHLVITDIILGGEISGVLLINKIRRLDGVKGDTPILAITAFDDTSRRISLYHMGITDYVTKPIIKEELLARVRNLIKNQKAIERELEFRAHYDSEEVVRRGLKLEALGQLTSGIAHDYNNMLGIIKGYTDLLKIKIKDDPKILNYVDQIDKANENGIKLTSKLLAFTRKQVVTSEVININKLIIEAQPMLEKLFTASIKLNMNLEESLWNVNIDSSDFENALLNLSINAKHAMVDKGKLTIITTNTKLGTSAAENNGLPAGEYIRLSIMDTGCGMDKETISKVFDPFFSTKGEGGSGLGLSQVYGFVQRAHGSIKVESKKGKGTLFTLYFPREEGLGISNKNEQTESRDEANNLRYDILVVDDEVALANLTSEVLQEKGHRVDTANNANEAIAALEEKKYDVMVSDVIMPGLNGFELAEKVRNEYPDIKIIMVSGYNDQVNMKEGAKDYYDKILEKPVSAIQLIKAIHLVL